MSSREFVRKKISSINQTSVTNPLQPRRLKVPAHLTQSEPQQQETPSISEQLERASRFGYNGLNVPVNFPTTPPTPPVQRKEGEQGNWDQPPRADLVLNGINQLTVQQFSQQETVQRQLLVQAQSSADEAVNLPSSQDLPPPEQRRMIRIGSQGKEVIYAQERLNAHAATPLLEVDSIFGPLTRKATLDYQNSHALVADAIIGPRTWASLDGPTVIGGKSGQGSGGGSSPSKGPTLKYDTTKYTITPPPPNTKLSDIKATLQTKQDQKPQPDLGKTLNVQGVTSGSQEEIFLWNVMLQLGTHDRWGSEGDVVTDIGWPTKPGNKPPVGQITLKIDDKGNAVAELVNKGAVASPPKFQSIDEVKKKLKADFKIADIKDGSANWKQEELEKVHAAFSRMPASDRAALEGVELIRQQKIVDDNGNELSGLFSHQAQLPQGGTSASRSQSLSLADLAFTGDNISFVGDKSNAAAASFQTILHEAGHAVETKALRDAQFATMEATAEDNQNIGILNAKIQALKAAVNAFNTESKAAFSKAKGYNSKQSKDAKSFLKAIDGATNAISTFSKNQTVSQHQKLESDASTAIQKRDAEKTKLASTSATHPALTDFANTIQRQNDWFAAAQKRAKAHTIQQASAEKVKQKQKDEKAVSGSKSGQSKRLKNFVDLVNKHKIPPLTDYAKKNWPNHPEEFFAEAYSLWLNDRTYLEANAKPLVDWFNSGEHLK
ncbi:MAG TPA: hypothetical protein DDZ80_26380 [Cyanobacteria bacterium UBA8803]|nr:hypothetical protein [Cyanobacteria bacterium UBA9273]HBL61811.1 hypothetical protein [Cyanobacteria bacterium UBA8803]